MTAQDLKTLEAFVQQWEDEENRSKTAFVQLKSYLAAKPGAGINFIARPGVTHSLRAAHRQQKTRPLFALVDVIEDEPRWLSVCFYEDMISDPEEKGNLLPGALLGEDGYCFDLDEYDSELIDYIISRVDEAWGNAPEA